MDFLLAKEAGLAAVPDPEVLALAANDDRILVSHDLRTMLRHFSDFLLSYGSSPGVLIIPQNMRIGDAIEQLVLIWAASDVEEWANRTVTLPL